MHRPLHTNLLIIVFLLLSFTSARAEHVLGGDITYTCIGTDSFEITLTLYRDCTGAAIPGTYSLSITSPNCGTSTLNLVRDTTNDITPICPSGTSPCSNPGSVLPMGIEQHVFTGLWIKPTGSACTSWTIYYDDCCRPLAGGPFQDNMYFSTELQTGLAKCNSSPVFTNLPVPYVCTGLPFHYNPGAVDPDGDSLVFSLVPCLQSDTAWISYPTSLSPTQPFYANQPTTIDPNTGALFTKPSISQIGTYCIRVDEYRNGVKIGEVSRDLRLLVTNCNNQPPQVSGINGGTNYDTAICPGQPIAFDVFSSDSTPFQDLVMSWNEGIPNATFNITGTQYPQGSFAWNTTINDIGTHFFTVNVIDDGCPITSQGFYTYTIHVRNPQITLPETLYACNGEPAVLDSSMVNMSVDFLQYSWTPASGIPNNDLYRSFHASTTTTYTLSATNGACSATAHLTVIPKSLDTSVANVNDTLYANQPNATYQWIDCDNNNAPIAGATGKSFRPSVTGNYAVLIDDDTCAGMSGCHQVIVLGRDGPKTAPDFQIFPNPSRGTIHLTLSGGLLPGQQLRIFDLNGREVYAEPLPRKTNHTLLLNLPNGLYQVVLESAEGSVVRSMGIVR